MAKHGESRRKTNEARLEHSRARRAVGFCSVFLAIVIAFCAGFIIRGNDALMTSLGFGLKVASNTNPGLTVSGNTYDSISARVAEVQGVLENESLDEYDLTVVTDKILTDFMSSVDDSYARYLTKERYNTYLKEAANTSYEGVGVLLAESESRIYVADVFEGSVAAAAGVRIGDFVDSINGDNVSSMTASEATNALHGEPGSTVVVTWRHPATSGTGTGEAFSTTLTCSGSTGINVTYNLSGNVGYISLVQITKNATDLVTKAVESLTSQGAEAFVLDLRNCSGGYLTEAVGIANLFMESGAIVQIVTKGATSQRSVTSAAITTAPIVALINNGTAGSAEVVAAALQDSGRATLVGSTTLGKGTVQALRALSFGGAIRYTVAEYKSPLGHTINGVGVSPDISVTLSTVSDNQKSLAIDMASSSVR